MNEVYAHFETMKDTMYEWAELYGLKLDKPLVREDCHYVVGYHHSRIGSPMPDDTHPLIDVYMPEYFMGYKDAEGDNGET